MIIHVDMDAFYTSVEERDRPELKGKPIIVGGVPGQRGVVAAANYVVRHFGVHSAMPSATAQRLCPQAIFLPGRLDYYAQVSNQIREIFYRFTPLVEPLSLDEAFLDVSGSEGLFGSAKSVGQQIKDAIRHELNLIASIGIASNKFLAKIASDLEKPDGFVVVDPDGIQAFLDPLPVERLWGVGRQTSKVFQGLGVRTIVQLRRLPPSVLKTHFGSHGEHLSEFAHGVDRRPVVPDREAKSISHETTFATDLDDREALRAWLLELTEQVARRLRRHALRGRTVEIKVRFADFRTITRSRKLPEPTSSTNDLWEAANELFNTRVPSDHLPVRLLGMGVMDIDRSGVTQTQLFGEGNRVKQDRLDEVGDLVRERFGSQSLSRGSTLECEARHRPKPLPAPLVYKNMESMLTKDQVKQFDELGYLFLPNTFSQAEMDVLSHELPGVLAQRRPEVLREKNDESVRTAFAAHHYNEAFRLLAHHPRMIQPTMELLDGPVYIHQFKVNAKAAFDGDVWQWHQDYGIWARDDLMPEPRAMNIAVFVDEVTEFNGPLMLIPKSHKSGVLEAGHDLATTSYPLWTLDKATVTRLVEEGGLVASKGPPGSLLMFHCNLAHASPGNISPWSRTIVYISACHVDNHIRRFQREEWIAHRDFTPLECEADDCLLAYGQRIQSAS